MRAARKFLSFYLGLFFLTRNIFYLLKKKSIPTIDLNGMVYRGGKVSDIKRVMDIYSSLNEGKKPSWQVRWLLKILGEKVLWVVVDKNRSPDEVIAVNIYYLNKRDCFENTIHEGFIGVIPLYQGKGIATELRRLSQRHYSVIGLAGISTRISIDNNASLASATKLGFVPVETYTDILTGERRHYMICDIRKVLI